MEMAATHYHCCSSLLLRSDSSLRLVHNLKLTNPKNSWLGTKIRVKPCSVSVNPAISVFHRRPLASTVSFSLATSNPDSVSSSGEFVKHPEGVSPGQEIPRWSSSAIKAIALAQVEARKLKRLTTGTETLILGVLVEGTNLANTFLRANGITLFKVKDEMEKLLGEADRFATPGTRPHITDDAQRALDWAVNKKIKSGESGEVTPTHIILGIWSEVDSPGHKILSNLGINEEKAKELEASISKSVVIDV
ncbi:unnamed protein product [Trifolium pratense]|uniref:Uncharacterized protein n=1 Tax=Trifolium pratense TaxID=57577 RepID=A0ACB0K1R8_TRIPR|nr:unnamed protein product [Trifolium pratense]